MLKETSYNMILAEVPERMLHQPVGVDPETGEDIKILDYYSAMIDRMLVQGQVIVNMNGLQSDSAHRHNSRNPDKVISIIAQFPRNELGQAAIRALQLHDALTDAEPREHQPGPASPEEALYQAYLDS